MAFDFNLENQLVLPFTTPEEYDDADEVDPDEELCELCEETSDYCECGHEEEDDDE